MRCGVSTACFFPGATLESLEKLGRGGVQVVELFFNTFSEMEDEYVAKLLRIKKTYGMEISSVHPCSSAMETFFFATPYQGRFEDGLKLYRQFYKICRTLGSNKLVFHGDHDYNIAKVPPEEYAARFARLAQAGREYGVELCHENVAYCRLGYAQRVRELRPLMAENAAFVLDIKQVRRNGEDVQQMVDAMAGAIRQVHISDGMGDEKCLLPGEGTENFAAFVKALRAAGYDGDLIIELYSDGFTTTEELVNAMDGISALL